MHAENFSFHDSYLFGIPQRETGRDGVPFECVLDSIQKGKHLTTLRYLKFSQTRLLTMAVVAISKQTFQVFYSRNLLEFP